LNIGANFGGEIALDTVQLTKLLANLIGAVSATDYEAVQNRVRDLQKRGFPSSARTGRGRKSTYTISDVVAAAAAITLSDLDMTSGRVVEILDQHRVTVQMMTVIGWRVVRIRRSGLSEDEFRKAVAGLEGFLEYVPCALGDRKQYEIFVMTPLSRERMKLFQKRRALIRLDCAALAFDLCDFLEINFRFTSQEVDAAFRDLGTQLFHAQTEDQWTVAAVESAISAGQVA